MFTRILNSRLPLIIYNPSKVFSLSFFKAVFNSGGLPVFDTEFLSAHEIIEGIKALIRADILFGLRLVNPDKTLLSDIKDQNPLKLDTIIFSMGIDGEAVDTDSIGKWFSNTKIILEVRQININDKIKNIAPHALIIRGNEAGGRVSNYSSFVLMQWYLKNSTLPVFVHGGVGRNTASGMFAAGASGVVLDSQVWLAQESPLSENFRKLMLSLDESDSMEISTDNRHIFRVFAKLGTKIARELKEKAIFLSDKENAADLVYKEIEDNIVPMDKSDASAVQSLLFLGQDSFFAKNFALVSSSLKEMISGFFKNIGEQLNYIDAFDPMRPDSPMAKDHNTRLPLIQGPMANVSDNADFAAKVLEAGALPFFAVGSLPPVLAENMLSRGSQKVSTFGAGLVGIEAFNPAVEKHLEMVKKYKAPFALFAGGIPSQAIDLEKSGTKTYLHTPSISMMENAMKSGCTRFIFEGREAGGHIGSLSSLVLWEAAIAKIKEKDDETLSNLSLVFAGGISTCFASCFISGIASCLAAKGVKIGIQVGTAYLFSEEIVETKSIKEQYQTILCEENETMVIGNSVGLASRTAPNEFARMMIETEKEMIKKGEKLEDRKRAFEKNNIGSLLIGAKGFLPDFKKMGEEHYTWFEGEEHRNRGNFLVGDSLAFFKTSVTLHDIHSTFFKYSNHQTICKEERGGVKQTLFENLNRLEILTSDKKSINDEIAVIGMGCILPDAHDPETLWENIISKRYSIKEMEDSRIRKDLYYDPDKGAEDRSYTMLAGYIDDFVFDHDRFGYDDGKAARLSRSQQLLLATAYQAVENAGYLDENFRFGAVDPEKKSTVDPEKTAVIIATCLGNELGNELQFKYHFPEILSMLRKTGQFNSLSQEKKDALVADLQKGMEGKHQGYDPIHGMLLNIEASRIAKHLGIRGINYVVDAACASSFTAIDAAIGELVSGDCDQVVVGGVNTHLAPESFSGFCKMGALSARGSFPFDERADGFILGEGAAVFVLKRMKDALRDNDNIIGVIKGIGGSSDGRGKAIAAPNINGQVLALQRCYENMDGRVVPEDIDFIEAHGTSTIMGDQAELQTIKMVYTGSGKESGSVKNGSLNKIGISSIKSQIGHLLGGAGAAGLVKALLAVQKGILPPNSNFEKLSHNHDLSGTGLYVIEQPTPWGTPEDKTRKAAVSSYGFGGINYHLVVEEFRGTLNTPLPRKIFTNPDYDFNDDRIVIAGMGLCLPGGRGKAEFWENLKSGKKQLSDIPEDRFDNSVYAEFDKKSHYHLPMVKAGVIRDFKFNNIKYRMPPSIVRSLERGQLLGLDAADEAINSSGLAQFTQSKSTRSQPGSTLQSNRIGVILGTIQGERQSKNILRVRKGFLAEIIENSQAVQPETAKDIASELVEAIRKRFPENNEDTTPGLLSNIISGRIANHFGLNGINYVIDASCASAVIAIKNAMRNIASKQLDFVLAGGVDANLYPAVLMAFKRIGLLSGTEPRFFDSRADGYAMSEGAAIHVLTTLKKAKESGMEILGELSDCSVKSSAPDHLLAPSEQTFVSTINESYKKSGIRKEDIGYLDLFAFSNIMGDMVEKQVVEKCFDHAKIVSKPASSSETSDITVRSDGNGNSNGNGTQKEQGESKKTPLYFGNVKTQFGYFKAANPAVALAKLALMNKNRTLLPNFDYDPKFSSLKNPILAGQKYDAPMRFAFNVNGIGGNHCHMILSALPPYLDAGEKILNGADESTIALEDKGGKSPAVSSASFDKTEEKPQVLNPSQQITVALLSGQGAQSPGMMKEMFDRDLKIREIMERGEAIFVAQRGYSLLDIMFGDDNRLNLTENTQPAVFLSSAALFTRLKGQDFTPDFFIGHSVGEYTALFCSGMLDFDDAMKLIIKRSDLMREAATEYPGKIMVVFGNEKDTASLIRESGASWLYITNKNSEKQTAVSGSEQDIEIFCKFLTSKNVVYKRLNLSGAFHTPLFRKAAESLKDYLDAITFNNVDFSKVISNVTATPYPEDQESIKELLAKQITSSVEFIKSVEYVHRSGNTHYMEIGPKKLLINLLKNINVEGYLSSVALESINNDQLEVVNENSILISGVSVGLPGKARKVFAHDNFDMILDGSNFIEPLTLEEQQKIVDKNVTRILKDPDGNARFVEIAKTEDVIHLAGQLGYFSLNEEYGIKAQYDISMALAVAAGIEALKDAGIPLVMQYKTPSRFKAGNGNGSGTDIAVSGSGTGSNGTSLKPSFTDLIPDGFALPADMQDETGVIITSLFPGNETLIDNLEKYFYDKLFLKPYEEFQSIYYYLMENVKDGQIKDKLTDWFFKIRKGKRDDFGPFRFDRSFLGNVCPLGSAHLAQAIRAKGPNTLISSACASTTQAVGIAEDWIKLGRCKRVIVIGGENATSPAQNQWIGTGFLALGAATVKKRVSEAAKPFDSDRNGTIIGAGAVGLVIEKASEVHSRGMRGQAVVLGTHMANSAYHTFNIDVEHMATQMKKFMVKMEKEHGLKQAEYAPKLLFMSHETYTPARGGSADAEVTALKTTFGNYLKNVSISNTKGFTGHTLGAAIEDVVMVKALQLRKAPPIANLVTIPDHFKELNFVTRRSAKSSGGQASHAEYGLHLAAGFGSHFAFLFIRRIEAKVQADTYNSWLKRISGSDEPELKIIDNRLCVVGPRSADLVPDDLQADSSVVVAGNMQISASDRTSDKTANRASGIGQPKPLTSAEPVLPVQKAGQANEQVKSVIKEIIASQTGYTLDMLESDLDLEADLGIDTVKQVEIFANAASHFGFPVPEDLKLRDLNTIAKLAEYIGARVSPAATDAGISTDVGTSAGSEALTSGMPLQESRVASGEKALASDTVSDLQKVRSVITDIIANQTGYTTDMLEADLDLEADLGIDTVKQVEIFANAASHFGFPVPEDLKLRDLNTIAKLAEYINGKIAPAVSQSTPTDDAAQPLSDVDKSLNNYPQEQTGHEQGQVSKSEISSEVPDADKSEAEANGIKRLVPVWRKTGLPFTEKWSFSGRRIALAGDDKYGVADFIKKQNGEVLEIKDPLLPVPVKPDELIDGFICITPFDVKSFFTIVKQLFSSLNQPGKLVAALSTCSSSGTLNSEPTFAGICGMMKSLAKEMPNTIVKAVSLFNDSDPVNRFMDEITSQDLRVETSYRNNEKYVVYLEELVPNISDSGLITKKDTILVTGGARGITFEILKAVVEKYHTNLVILGRSSIDTNDQILGLDSTVADDESAIMAKLKQSMKGAKPVELKQAAKRLVSAGESRKNIQFLKSFGVDVTYIAADVTDKDAMVSALSAIDHVDGVIHAAGVEESMPFEKKSLDSFERVFNTKVDGCRNLIHALDGKGVRFYVGFSSVTAKFGNEGQTDYTAANEMMAAILFELNPGMLSSSNSQDSSHSGTAPKCKVIDWTAWSGAGMATRETVQKVLAERGLKFLPLEAGVRFFMDEMEDSTTPEVVITGLDHSFDRDGILRIAPFLDSKSPVAGSVLKGSSGEETQVRSFSRKLEIARDRFLLDHAMDGTPIFLGATGVETMAEAVIATCMETRQNVRVAEIKDFSIPYGIKLLQNKPKDIIVTATGSHCTITSQFINSAGVPMGEPKLHYQAQFVVKNVDEINEKKLDLKYSTINLDPASILQKSGIGEKDTGLVYHPQRLFMDGVFRSIYNILSFDGKTLITKIADRSRGSFFTDDPCPAFLTDVVLLDGMFQTGGVFEFMSDSFVVLPYKIKSLKFFSRGVKDVDYMCITTRTASDEETDTFDIDLVDAAGSYLMELTGFQMVKLNRLSDGDRIRSMVGF